MRRAAVLIGVVAVGLGGLLARPDAARQAPPDRSTWRWYKGNTHAHTTESDGDSSPETVTRWYRDQGYQFLVLSDHNVLTNIEALSRTFAVPEQFLLVPGEEVTDVFEKAPLHINGLNVTRLVEPRHGASIPEILQRNIDAIREARGVPHVNHPNFVWAIAPDHLQQLERYRLLEIFNGHPLVNNEGGGDMPGMETVWDRLLTSGRRVYGIAVDDAHHFTRPWDPTASKPGKGWVVVRAPRLDASALMASLEAGDFYASTGVELEAVEATADAIEIRVHPQGDARYRITLVDASGAHPPVEGLTARFPLTAAMRFARVTVRDSNGHQAWTQPVFFD
ncbi:MAG: CehA/McbA family metallohydrolase [Vicinamibacterales bacterium]